MKDAKQIREMFRTMEGVWYHSLIFSDLSRTTIIGCNVSASSVIRKYSHTLPMLTEWCTERGFQLVDSNKSTSAMQIFFNPNNTDMTTSTLKALHMKATGILSRREAIMELINEDETPQGKAALKKRLQEVTAQYGETITTLLESLKVDKVLERAQHEFGIDPELLENCIKCTL